MGYSLGGHTATISNDEKRLLHSLTFERSFGLVALSVLTTSLAIAKPLLA